MKWNVDSVALLSPVLHPVAFNFELLTDPCYIDISKIVAKEANSANVSIITWNYIPYQIK
jgi:hypothetical protein